MASFLRNSKTKLKNEIEKNAIQCHAKFKLAFEKENSFMCVLVIQMKKVSQFQKQSFFLITRYNHTAGYFLSWSIFLLLIRFTAVKQIMDECLHVFTCRHVSVQKETDR